MTEVPAGAMISSDGRWWWLDGTSVEWQPTPESFHVELPNDAAEPEADTPAAALYAQFGLDPWDPVETASLAEVFGEDAASLKAQIDLNWSHAVGHPNAAAAEIANRGTFEGVRNIETMMTGVPAFLSSFDDGQAPGMPRLTRMCFVVDAGRQAHGQDAVDWPAGMDG